MFGLEFFRLLFRLSNDALSERGSERLTSVFMFPYQQRNRFGVLMCRSEARRIIAFKLFKRLIHFNTNNSIAVLSKIQVFKSIAVLVGHAVK